MDVEAREQSNRKVSKNKKIKAFKKKRSAADETSKIKIESDMQGSIAKNKKSFKNRNSLPADKFKIKHDKEMQKKNFNFKKNKHKKLNKDSENAQTADGDEKPKLKLNKRKSDEGESSPSKKPKLHNLKFKERKLIRKQKKKVSFDVVKLMKNYWEDLRREDCSSEKKNQLLKQICGLVKDRIKEFMFAHDTVRVLECVLSEGKEEHRTLIFEEIKNDIVTLSQSKYGKFLVMKVLRYGTKKQKEAIMAAFNGSVTRLMKHTEAADVIETAFNECANAMQRFQMVQEFYGANYRLFKESNIHSLAELLQNKPETKESVLNSMKEELMKVLEKSVLKHSLIHHVLLQFFMNCDPSSRSEIIESLREVVPEILHTKDGSRVAMQCVWHGNQKDRKVIIKHMRTFVSKIAMEEHGHMVLLAIFDCVDDTTYVDKIIIKELQEKLLEIAQNVHGKKVLVYLLNPRDPHFFHPDVINILKNGDNNATSKKNPEKRRYELNLAVSPHLTQLIVNNIADLYKDNPFCLFTLITLKHAIGDKRQAYESIAKLLSEPYTTENKNVHIIENTGAGFMLKQLVLNDKIEKTADQNLDSVTFSEVLISTVPNGIMKTWFACNRGAFLLLNLLETEIPAVVEKIRGELMGCHKQLDKLHFKGAELLVRRLRKLSVDNKIE